MTSDEFDRDFFDELDDMIAEENAANSQSQNSGWLSGARDVTELPTISLTFTEIEVDSELTFNKKHLEGFLKLDGIRWNDYNRQIEVSNLKVGDSRMRTYRKMYERLGLLYHNLEDDTIKISPLGIKIKNLSDTLNSRVNGFIETEKLAILREIQEIAISVLSKYQLRNPADKTNSLPATDDVLPCICIWKAMLELDGKLHYQEINRVLMKVMRMKDLDTAIEKIKQAREVLPKYTAATKVELEQHLGIGLVEEAQTSARIAPWFSFAGWGGLIIERDVQLDGFRHLVPESTPLIQRAVLNPPQYFDTDDEEAWFNYYLSDLKVEKVSQDINDLISAFSKDLASAGLTYEQSFIRRFVASCRTKPFVILTGLSGSGKTKLAQAFARWLTPLSNTSSDPFSIGAEIRSEGKVFRVINSDDLSVELSGSGGDEDNGRVLLARELIYEWAESIKKNNFPQNTHWKIIREQVKTDSNYVYRQHSTGAALKASAFALLNSKPTGTSIKHYEVVAVGPDWTSKDAVLGYPDALDSDKYVKTQTLELILRAVKHTRIPHFLILDEMNLSHVERYFADFLSSLESNEPIWLHSGKTEKDGIPPKIDALPKNLFIIGTVNVDETTYMFSPKVLDRANVLEFRVGVNDMNHFLLNANQVNLSSLSGKGAGFANHLVQTNTVIEINGHQLEIVKNEIMLFFELMTAFNTEFGYRNAREIIQFVSNYDSLSNDELDLREAIDAQIFQKLLPKLNGSRQKIGPLLNAMATLCYKSHTWDEQGNITNSTDLLSDARDSAKAKQNSFDARQINATGDYEYQETKSFYPLSFAKIRRMIEGLEQGFTSFTEA